MTEWPATGTRAIVGQNQEDSIVKFIDTAEKVQNFADLLIRMSQEAAEDLHLAREYMFHTRRQVSPRRNPRRATMKAGSIRHHTEFQLSVKEVISPLLPARVEISSVFQ
ncbi:hypothetical protein BAY61_22555 [Prauserella marina]|nr:hypothetical protein BAY61_22555 [Prauserella marina]